MSRTDKDGPHHPRTGLKLLVGGAGPSREFIHHDWTDRERQLVRAECHRAVQEHRGNGMVDTIPSTRQHRHGVQWLWW